LYFICALLIAVISCINDGDCPSSHQMDLNSTMNRVMTIKEQQWSECADDGRCPVQGLSTVSNIKCVDGRAGEYDCENVDLMSFVPLSDLGCGGDGNDIWGWTDVDGKEYAIFCCYDGTSFIDVTDPYNPKVLGFMRTTQPKLGSLWRDAKVYKDHAFVVSEEKGHGMQVFDLTRLRDAKAEDGITIFEPDYHYDCLGSVHNIAINEESGFAYAVGSTTCNSGLHMIDIREPKLPKFAGCFGADGYVHDTQCVNYTGPDTRYTDQEICFCYNEDTLTIVDVTEKTSPIMLSRTGYKGFQYTHQGWLLESSEYLLANDELDEIFNTAGPDGGKGKKTRTMKWNVKDLRNPILEGSFISPATSIDHNLYVLGNTAYLANYCSGLRVLDLEDWSNVKQAGFFDVSPDCDTTEFFGSWSSYPYFKSKSIVVSSIERGLFVLDYKGNH